MTTSPIYKCCHPECPGYPYKASDMGHPATTCTEDGRRRAAALAADTTVPADNDLTTRARALPAREEMLRRLAELDGDARLDRYPHADVFCNSVLALVQTSLRAEAQTLRWVLGLPFRQYHGQDDAPSEVARLLTEGAVKP